MDCLFLWRRCLCISLYRCCLCLCLCGFCLGMLLVSGCGIRPSGELVPSEVQESHENADQVQSQKSGQLTQGTSRQKSILTPSVKSGQKESDPDIRYIHNGYGTIFVTGRRIEHAADTSTSTVVDWRKEKTARASRWLDMKEEDGIVYKTGEVTDGKDKGDPIQLHLNLKKDAKAKGKLPVILFVPGGGFISCHIDNKYTAVHRYLVEKGYAVAVMEYHIIGQGRYVDAAEDIRDAIDWIKEYGRSYGLDRDRIYLIGNSGGGYLASLEACRNSDDIRCVVNFYGLCDLLNNKSDYEPAAIRAHHRPESSDSQFVNGVYSGKGLTDDLQEASKADPRTYIDGDEPAFLHLHGDQDLLVSPSQSLHLHQALTDAGVRSVRYVLHGEGHGARGFRTEKALDLAVDFMGQY